MAINEDNEISDVYENGIYWTDSADVSSPYLAWGVLYDGLNYGVVEQALYNGVRPIVKIIKSNL